MKSVSIVKSACPVTPPPLPTGLCPSQHTGLKAFAVVVIVKSFNFVLQGGWKLKSVFFIYFIFFGFVFLIFIKAMTSL